ncbi:MAG: phosphoglycerate mutase family protein [Sandaracinaceae bacterium]|nr:phosphoglycerate mutase family protein [Sandaracinaceae bacterium]
MTRVLFVRHGQASAGASDYDELSPLGRAQSRHLGRWLAQKNKAPTHVYVGPRKRHADTFSELAAAYHDAIGLTVDGALVEDPSSSLTRRMLPEPVRLESLDEHHGIQLLVSLGPALAERDDAIGRAARRAFAGGGKRAFIELVLLTMPAWARGELHHPDVESWADFMARARTIAPRLAHHGEQANVWVISSGGLISTVVGESLGCSVDRVFELMFAMRNTAMSELSVRRDAGEPGLSLFSFNALPHLDEDQATFV